jgi:hypothetical protein
MLSPTLKRRLRLNSGMNIGRSTFSGNTSYPARLMASSFLVSRNICHEEVEFLKAGVAKVNL